jgi:lipopolysaccharide/colanic/teichoic acid biosynthesis glycosyltransferase
MFISLDWNRTDEKTKREEEPNERKTKKQKKEKKKNTPRRADFLKLIAKRCFLMLFRLFLGFVLCFTCKLLFVYFLIVLKALFDSLFLERVCIFAPD